MEHKSERQSNAATTGNRESGSSSTTQMKDKVRSMPSKPGSGRPDDTRNQSDRSGTGSQQLNAEVDTNGGQPSRQTTDAGKMKGQL